ncbi:MAG: flavodoxin family protein [Planctomycetes bacterium]|nr:flavodoxin family protein [Planctomycetota bacterium]
MSIEILGISGSPIINGNTDRLVKAILKESERDSKFTNLSKLNFGSCRGCAHNCATTSMCGVKDDLFPYLKDIRDSKALVFGTAIHHGTMTAWMYSFFSRLWCFLHENKTLNSRPVIFVSVGIDDIRKDRGPFRASLVKEHKFNIIGEIYFRSLVPPCFKCGKGDRCQWGGLWRMVGRDTQALQRFKITSDKFRKWEDDEQITAAVKKYGKILSEILS